MKLQYVGAVHQCGLRGIGIEKDGDVTIVGAADDLSLTLTPDEILTVLDTIKEAGIAIDRFAWDGE